jgi:pimeloyl-ACP methyl ester carboxylesterase
MSDTPAPVNPSPAALPPHLDPNNIVVGKKSGVVNFSHSDLDIWMTLPLPGVMIFVHGVNSDGEWFEQAENGLCDGLNERLKRCDEHLAYTGTEAGQLKATGYIAEHTPQGFINPDLNAKSFIQTDDTYSPVIRFRWGYKASAKDLQNYGDALYLNEQDYWGCGPFANGCTALPDLWGEGLETQIFLSLKVQSLNSTNDRQVYNCPPRPYYVLAALRLAKLVHALRQKQADLPITIVCHSQGNMVGMAAAFLGDALYKDDGVADTYVLCNPPYSLLKSNGPENFTQRAMKDAEGRHGRQTYEARVKTLANFFDLVRKRNVRQQSAASVNEWSANEAHGFTAQLDRAAHGYQDSTYGRVTLYCNPHDQVISSASVQGIGWRGLDMAEIKASGGDGVFAQRVFSQGFKVGAAAPGAYRYWADQHGAPKEGTDAFWSPESQTVQYDIGKSMDANTSYAGKAAAVLMAPFKVARVFSARLNALPPKGWTIPLEARPLPKPFDPEAVIFDKATPAFDEGADPPGANRNANAAYADGDPYGGASAGDKDAPKGDERTEAAQRYDDHAYLRMRARREGLYKKDAKVLEEDKPETASADYTAWRNKTIKANLAANVDTHATDHSTIMTNPMHARMALAYDVAVGHCTISEEDLHYFRRVADWRLLEDLDKNDLHFEFFEYFDTGKFKNKSMLEWANAPGSEGCMPAKIVNRREVAPAQQVEPG